MTRRLSLFFASLFLLWPLVACVAGGSSPERIARDYTNLLSHGHPDKAWNLISANDTAVMDKQAFLNMHRYGAPLREFFAKTSTAKFTTQTIHGNAATVLIETTAPDISEVMTEALLSAVARNLRKDPDRLNKDIVKRAQRALKNGKLKDKTFTDALDLVKENGEWKIFLHSREKKEKKQREARIRDLLNEGRNAIFDHEFDKAAAVFEQVRAIEPHSSGLKAAEARLRHEIKVDAYIDKVKIYDFQARYANFETGRTAPRVDFKLLNAGDQTLTRVSVKVYFKDKDGNTISKQVFGIPFYVTDPLRPDVSPLKPGQAWQAKPGKFFSASPVPREWKEGAAETKVVGLRFLDDE